MSPDAALTPRQRELLGVKPESDRGGSKGQGANRHGGGGMTSSADHPQAKPPQVHRFSSGDAGLKPKPPSSRLPGPTQRSLDGGSTLRKLSTTARPHEEEHAVSKKGVYTDNRMGFQEGKQRRKSSSPPPHRIVYQAGF